MRTSKLKINSEKSFSDLDFLLINFSFASYVLIRFLIESGWLFGTAFSILIFFALRKLARARHTIYLYVILLFTTENEQKWLLRKFSLNSKIYSSLKPNKFIDQMQINDALNKAIEVLWPFIKSYLEEVIKQKVSFFLLKMKSTRLQPLIQYFTDLQDEEINLGLQPPIIELIEIIPSRKVDVMVININFWYLGNGILKFFTRLKNIIIKDIKMKGCLRAEVGPLLSAPPFIQGVKVFMTEEPQLDFSVLDVPNKIEKLVKILSLERISEKLVMPNQIHVSLHPDTIINCLPSGVIFIHVVEGRDLPNNEIFFESDPFCVVQLGSKKVVSTTIKRTLNPVWKFKTQMICFCDPRHGDFDLHFTIFDKDVLLDDVLLRSKLSVRRILEEKVVDEWLYSNDENMEDKDRKGRLRVQAFWQDLSSIDPSLYMSNNGEERTNKKEEETDVSTDAELSQYSNLTEMNSLDSCEIFNRKEVESFKKHSNGDSEFYKAVLLVWVETAQKLEPSWEDFQIKMKFYDSVEKTSFVPRDLKSKWAFRQRFLFPVTAHKEDSIKLKVVSRTKNKCVGHLFLNISKIIQEFSPDGILKDVFLRNENEQELEASVKLAFLIKKIEPLSLLSRILMRSAENEAELSTVKDPPITIKPDSPKSDDEVSEEAKKKKSPKSRPIFTFTEASLNICSPFVRSNPSENEGGESQKQGAETFPPSFNEGDSKKTHEKVDEAEQSEVSCKDDGSHFKRKDSKRASRWSMWKYGRKIKKDPKNN